MTLNREDLLFLSKLAVIDLRSQLQSLGSLGPNVIVDVSFDTDVAEMIDVRTKLTQDLAAVLRINPAVVLFTSQDALEQVVMHEIWHYLRCDGGTRLSLLSDGSTEEALLQYNKNSDRIINGALNLRNLQFIDSYLGHNTRPLLLDIYGDKLQNSRDLTLKMI